MTRPDPNPPVKSDGNPVEAVAIFPALATIYRK